AGVLGAELLHPSGGVEQTAAAGPKWMAGRGDLDVDDRVRVAVLPLDGLLAGRGRAGEEGEARVAIAIDDGLIVGVNVLFHAASVSGRGKHPAKGSGSSRQASKPSASSASVSRQSFKRELMAYASRLIPMNASTVRRSP